MDIKKFSFKKIDAFASEHSSGNPAGYISLNSFDEITYDEMLAVAKEMGGYVSEVGFACKINDTTYKLRYFSAEREVQFCGHATIAIAHDIIKNSGEIGQKNITVITNKGELVVENRVEAENIVFITAPSPTYIKKEINKTDLSVALGIDEREITGQPEIINGGLNTLIIEISSLSTILGIAPDLQTLKEHCLLIGVDIVEVFCRDTVNKNSDYRTRVFAATFGYLEDPATGSGNSAFGYYLIKHGLWSGGTVTIEQNGSKSRYNVIKLKSSIDENGVKRVMFGGGGFSRIEGTYYL